MSPEGVVGLAFGEQRRTVSEALLTGMMPAEVDAPEESIASARAYTQVVVHEPATWTVGGASIGQAELPRYVVRVTVLGSWRKEMSAFVIPEVTRALATIDPNPEQLYSEPRVWVQVLRVPEGSCGIFGQPMGSTAIFRAITKPQREGGAARRTADLAPGTALDPTCGMVVALADAAAVVDTDDGTYAFCSSACHAVFEQDPRSTVG